MVVGEKRRGLQAAQQITFLLLGRNDADTVSPRIRQRRYYSIAGVQFEIIIRIKDSAWVARNRKTLSTLEVNIMSAAELTG